MLGCKAFEAAPDTLAGVDLMHRMQQRQLKVKAGNEGRSVLYPGRLITALTGVPHLVSIRQSATSPFGCASRLGNRWLQQETRAWSRPLRPRLWRDAAVFWSLASSPALGS